MDSVMREPKLICPTGSYRMGRGSTLDVIPGKPAGLNPE
jgi:hypothetical protein